MYIAVLTISGVATLFFETIYLLLDVSRPNTGRVSISYIQKAINSFDSSGAGRTRPDWSMQTASGVLRRIFFNVAHPYKALVQPLFVRCNMVSAVL